MQAKLPDINSAIVRHRTGALTAMSQLNYSLASTELGAINALLPEDYKVKEDSEEYYKIIKSQDVLVCECGKETEFIDIVFYQVLAPVQLQLLYAVEKITVWQCLHCNALNPKEGSKRIIRQKQNPFYTGFMPIPPQRSHFGNSLQYKYKFEKWFDIALTELEQKIGLYRTDYAAQQDDDSPRFDDEDDNHVTG